MGKCNYIWKIETPIHTGYGVYIFAYPAKYLVKYNE